MDWPPGAHASTFGGNPVSCAAALATIKLLRESLVANAADVGAFLLEGARALMDKHQIIGDVRGKGLMIGIEFVKDRKTKERAVAERDAIVQAAFYSGPAGARRRQERDPPLAAAGADQARRRHRAGNAGRGNRRGRGTAPLMQSWRRGFEPLASSSVLDAARSLGVRSAPRYARCTSPRACPPPRTSPSANMGNLSPFAPSSAKGTQFLPAATALALGEIDIIARDGPLPGVRRGQGQAASSLRPAGRADHRPQTA